MILTEMYYRHNILMQFKKQLLAKGYTFKTLNGINSQLELLDDLIKSESFEVLNELLRKTNYRLLKEIHKGNHNLPSISNNPESWTLCNIKDNEKEWLNNNALIFSTERQTLVFTNNMDCCGVKYVNNKWQ